MSDSPKCLHNTETRSATATARRQPAARRLFWLEPQQLVEYGPLIFISVALWSKLTWFSISLRAYGCGCQTPFVEWMMRYPGMMTASLGTVLLLLAVVPILPRPARLATLMILDLYITILVVASAVHFECFWVMPFVSGLTLFGQLFDVRSAIFDQLQWSHVLYSLDLAIAALTFPLWAWRSRRIPCLSLRSRTRVSCGMLLVGVLLGIPPARLVWQNKGPTEANSSSQIDSCARLGLVTYHILEVTTQLSPKPEVDAASKERVRQFIDNERREKATRSELFGAAKGLNLIFVNAESLQAFPIGMQLEGQPIAPRLTEFSNECLNFVNFHDQTHIGVTSDAVFCSLQSLHPWGDDYVCRLFKTNHFRGFPASLADAGYQTVSAVAATSTFWGFDGLLPKTGVQHGYWEPDYDIIERIGPWLADHHFFGQSVPMLQELSEPFAAILLTATNHNPFELPAKYRKLDLGVWEGTHLGNFLHTFHYFDWAFGQFVDDLRENGLLDRSVFVLYGDHHAFQTNDEVASFLGYNRESEYDQWIVRKKLPLLIRFPHAEHASVRTAYCGHLDIAPTVLSLLGVPVDNEVMLGNDLSDDKDSFVVFRDGSFVDGKHYFINRFGPIENCSCYEAESGRRADVALMEANRKRARERLEISDLILRGDMIPELCSSYRGPESAAEVRTYAVPPPAPNAARNQKSSLGIQVRYRNPNCSKVTLVWGFDKFSYVPKKLPRETILTLGGSHMNAPMQRVGNEFVIDIEVERNDLEIEFAFLVTQKLPRESVELWKGADESGKYYRKSLSLADAASGVEQP